MIYSALSKFDPIVAAGILARAALAVTDNSNPAGEERIQNEHQIRLEILNAIRGSLGVPFDDNSPETIEKIGDALDAECELLVGTGDQKSTLSNLSSEGRIPSDLFEIEVVNNIEKFHGNKFHKEKELIDLTVKSPDQEQHYGEPIVDGAPFLISLFAKSFTNKFPLRNFMMLVAGQRKGLALEVHQAWRIYTDLVDIHGVTSLVEILERFSNKFGAEIEVGGKIGHFFKSVKVQEDENFPPTINVQIRRSPSGKKLKKSLITVTSFYQQDQDDKGKNAALVVAIDLVLYEEVLKMRGW